MLYVIAAMLTILWIVGFFVLHVGILIHILLPVAVALVMLQRFRGNRTGKHPSFKPMDISIRK